MGREPKCSTCGEAKGANPFCSNGFHVSDFCEGIEMKNNKLARLICRLVGHRQAERAQVTKGQDYAVLSCPRCGALTTVPAEPSPIEVWDEQFYRQYINAAEFNPFRKAQDRA